MKILPCRFMAGAPSWKSRRASASAACAWSRRARPGPARSGCPFRITMFEDGIKTKGWDGQMQVKDISEFIVAALPKEGPRYLRLQGLQRSRGQAIVTRHDLY